MELPKEVEEFAEFFSGEGLTEDHKLDKLGWIIGLVRKQGEINEEFKRRIDLCVKYAEKVKLII